MTLIGDYRPRGAKVRPLSKESIRSYAQKVCDVAALVVPPLPGGGMDVVSLIEALDAQEIIRLEILPDADMGGDAGRMLPGFTQADLVTVVEVGDSLYMDACNGNGFARFTLAHELGHVFLHGKQPAPMARASLPTKHRPFEDSEWQADQFAAELLMDLRIIQSRSIRSWQEIATTFKVSDKAAQVRWEKIRALVQAR